MGSIHQFLLNISFKAVRPFIPPSRESKALMWGSAERLWENKMRAGNVTTITKTSISPRLLEDTLLVAMSHTERYLLCRLQYTLRELDFSKLRIAFFFLFPAYSTPHSINFAFCVWQAGDTVLSISEAWHPADFGIISTGFWYTLQNGFII